MVEFENQEALRKYLYERFAIELPSEIYMKQTKTHGIRVFSSSVSTDVVFGLEGFMAYSKSTGLSQYFIQLIGHLASKNIIALNRKDALAYALGAQLKKKLNLEPGLVILAYKNHILGYGVLEGKGSIKCPIKDKQKREFVNDVKGYPGRNL